MSLFWSKGAHRGQKIFSVFTLYLLLSVAVYIFTYHDFIPSRSIFWPSLIVSLAISLTLILLMIKGLKNKTWKPTKEFSTYSLIKKITAYLTLPIFIFFATWLNFYYLAPRAITSLTGEEGSRIDTATAQKNHGRRNTCDFSIKLHTTQSFMFKFCTNSVFYANSPKDNFRVKINTKESSLGVIVTSVDRIR